MSEKLFDVFQMIEIPIPTASSLIRRAKTSNVFVVRKHINMSPHENKMIHEAAQRRNMNDSAFMRWCAYQTAKKILGR